MAVTIRVNNTLRILGAALISSAVSISTYANSCTNGPADESSAERFVQDYYARLSQGVNRDQLRRYMSSEQNQIIDTTIFRLATDLGHDIDQEAQRLMDSFGVQAACEDMANTTAKVWGAFTSFATVSHDIVPKCTQWTNNQSCAITLRYSNSLCHWVITDISNQVEYQ